MKEEQGKGCGVCRVPRFERNNYFYGKLMTSRDFFAEQCYFNEKRRLINRIILGWGVVCGLDVQPKEDCPGEVIVTPGLAIDCCGREILVCCDQTIELTPELSACPKGKAEEGKEERKLYICLEYHECLTEPVQMPVAACDRRGKGEYNRIRDSYRITVKSPGEVEPPSSCQKSCPLSEDKLSPMHDFLCGKLKEGCPECPEKTCLILAEVTITPANDPSKPPAVVIDSCSPRRLVYGNSMLYDLISCFHADLPRIRAISWKENGARLSWSEFEKGIYKDGLKVWFDQKMDEETINANTFRVMVKMEDADTGNFRYDMIPGDLSYHYDEAANTSVATFSITSKWLIDVFFGYSRIQEKGGEFLVVLKGDFIMSAGDDCNPPKSLDGDFIAGCLPSGNGTAGGDFESWFYVSPKPEETAAKKKK